MKRGAKRWTVDWAGSGEPAVGDLVRDVRRNRVAGYFRVVAVRLVKNRKPLPAGYVARYTVHADLVGDRHPGEPVDWTLWDLPPKPKVDKFSPLLDP